MGYHKGFRKYQQWLQAPNRSCGAAYQVYEVPGDTTKIESWIQVDAIPKLVTPVGAHAANALDVLRVLEDGQVNGIPEGDLSAKARCIKQGLVYNSCLSWCILEDSDPMSRSSEEEVSL